jgi:hypothetical protein
MTLWAVAVFAVFSSAAASPRTDGRWTSSENVSMAGTAKVGSQFFLDVVVAADGTFRGSWAQYECFSYPGAYGINIVACQRRREEARASGRFDLAEETGSIELAGLGKTSLRVTIGAGPKGEARLKLELPPGWLKQGEPVLYETTLTRR